MSKLIEITTDQGKTRFSTTQVDVEHGGFTWVGGKVGSVSKVTQKAEIESGKLTITLSGVDQTVISLFNNEDYRNRECTVYECDVSPSWEVSNVVEYYAGSMITVSYELGATESEVTLSCKALYGSINRANAPDLGLLHASTINDDTTIYFGKTGPINSPGGGKPGGRVEYDIEP